MVSSYSDNIPRPLESNIASEISSISSYIYEESLESTLTSSKSYSNDTSTYGRVLHLKHLLICLKLMMEL